MKKTLLAIILAYSSNQTFAQGPLAADTNQPVYSANKAGNIAVGRNTYYSTPRHINTIQKDNDHDSLRYAEFVTPLFKALQDLTAQLNAQHEEIKALKENNNSQVSEVTWARPLIRQIIRTLLYTRTIQLLLQQRPRSKYHCQKTPITQT